jgi:hypothetical protein
MPIDINCPGCGLAGSAPDKLHGKTIKCRRCETAIKVQRPSLVVPVDAALLQEAAAVPQPQRPRPPAVDPRSQPRVRDFSFKWLFAGLGISLLFLILSLLMSGAARALIFRK